MTDETHLSLIEETLQAEAGRLLVEGGRPSAAELRNKYRRRRANRLRMAATCAILLVAALASVVARRNRQGTFPARDFQAPAALAHQEPATTAPVAADVRARTSEAEGDALVGVPFEIDDPVSGQVIPGIYVPEQVEPIDWQRLSPAERRAVGAVLEIDAGPAESEVI
ncbi:MAG TPA: hypothetical protein VFI31_01980 [Pirellulales bacterium]|nr:hypothetical protein [Pirellulales bacterium]